MSGDAIFLSPIFLGRFALTCAHTFIPPYGPYLAKRLNSTTDQLSWLYTFSWLCAIPVGLAIVATRNRIDPEGYKAAMLFFIAIATICSAASGLTVNLAGFIAVRCLFRMAYVGFFGSATGFLSHVETDPFALLVAFELSGSLAECMTPVTGVLINAIGWRNVFYLFTVVGCAVALVIAVVVAPPKKSIFTELEYDTIKYEKTHLSERTSLMKNDWEEYDSYVSSSENLEEEVIDPKELDLNNEEKSKYLDECVEFEDESVASTFNEFEEEPASSVVTRATEALESLSESKMGLLACRTGTYVSLLLAISSGFIWFSPCVVFGLWAFETLNLTLGNEQRFIIVLGFGAVVGGILALFNLRRWRARPLLQCSSCIGFALSGYIILLVVLYRSPSTLFNYTLSFSFIGIVFVLGTIQNVCGVIVVVEQCAVVLEKTSEDQQHLMGGIAWAAVSLGCCLTGVLPSLWTKYGFMSTLIVWNSVFCMQMMMSFLLTDPRDEAEESCE